MSPADAAEVVFELRAGRSLRSGALIEWVATADHADGDRVLDDLARAARDSTDALDALIGVLYRSRFVRSVIRRVVLFDDAADEALQHTTLAVAQGLHRWREESSFRQWVAGIASRQAAAVLRSSKAGASQPEASVDDLLPAHRFSSQLADRAVIEQTLADLPDAYRDVVVLRDVDRLPYADIAEQVGIPLNTVRSRLARGRALAQRALDGSEASAGALATAPHAAS